LAAGGTGKALGAAKNSRLKMPATKKAGAKAGLFVDVAYAEIST
jgi:hypothetical protein